MRCLTSYSYLMGCSRSAPVVCSTGGRLTVRRRRSEDSVLHWVVREHLETFLAEAQARGAATGCRASSSASCASSSPAASSPAASPASAATDARRRCWWPFPAKAVASARRAAAGGWPSARRIWSSLVIPSQQRRGFSERAGSRSSQIERKANSGRVRSAERSSSKSGATSRAVEHAGDENAGRRRPVEDDVVAMGKLRSSRPSSGRARPSWTSEEDVGRSCRGRRGNDQRRRGCLRRCRDQLR